MDGFSGVFTNAINYISDASGFVTQMFNFLPEAIRELFIALFIISVAVGVIYTVISIVR